MKTVIKARRLSMDTIFGNFEKRYCSLCKKYNSNTTCCDILKRKIRCPNEPYCSWFMKKLEGK